MIKDNTEIYRVAPWPQSIAIVIITTLACLAITYFLWAFISFSACSMHDMFGDVALPLFTGMLIQYRILFWTLPILSVVVGIVMLAGGKHSTCNLLLYVSTLVFVTLVAITFTIVALAIPWMPLMAN